VNHPEEFNPPEEQLQPADPLAETEHYAEVEAYLVRALRPIDPVDDLADRILALAQQPQPAPAKVIPINRRMPVWASGAIAAALLVGIFVTEQTHVQHEKQKVEQAQRQFETALKITNETLEQTRQELKQAGIEIGN
jgi:type VI protein secretion system component VasF